MASPTIAGISDAAGPVLSDEMLARFAARAPRYDEENRFFGEDFDELREAGYLRLAVPAELGGFGRSLPGVLQEQRRLAYHAAPTALGVHMHLHWTGVAADLWRAGDRSLQWLLEGAVQGEVLTAGHAERSGDIPVLWSATKAERVEGGYRLTGLRAFTSLTPVWTLLSVHGMETSQPGAPQIVHAFVPRETEGVRIEETSDILGMRATRSDDTLLDGAFVPDRYVARVVPAGAAGLDPFVLALFTWALLGFANVYYGLARRALDLAIEAATRKRPIALAGPMSRRSELRRRVAEMGLALEPIGPHLDGVAGNWSPDTHHGTRWLATLMAARHHAVEGAWRIADLALEVAGEFGVFHRGGLERLLRDARIGRIHPANSMLTHEVVARTLLGIDLDDRQMGSLRAGGSTDC